MEKAYLSFRAHHPSWRDEGGAGAGLLGNLARAEAEAVEEATLAARAALPPIHEASSNANSCVASADGEVEVEECFVQYG